MADIPFAVWKERFAQGSYDDNNRLTQCYAGWYDWFCKDTSLGNKTKRLGSILKGINQGGKIDIEKNYVFFKNNCPLEGNLYDDFRFADLETSEVLFTTVINCGYEDARYVVYGRKNNFEEPLFKTNSVRELKKWFNTPWQ